MKVNSAVTVGQLDGMTAEVLPERSVLSVVVPPPWGGDFTMPACAMRDEPGPLGLNAPLAAAGTGDTTAFCDIYTLRLLNPS